MVFSVVMYGCERWTIRGAECRRLMLSNCGAGEDFWESLGCKEIKLFNPKGNQPWILIERLMLKLKLQRCGHLMQRTDSLEKTPMLGKIEGGGEGDDGGWDGWMESPTQWTWIWVNSGSWCGQGGLVCCSPWSCRVGHDQTTELNWVDGQYILNSLKRRCVALLCLRVGWSLNLEMLLSAFAPISF